MTKFEQEFLPLPGLEPPPDSPEVVAGQIAGEIFRPWFKEFYEGRYTQPIPHLMKVLKQTVLDVVINGDTPKEDVVQALNHIGHSQQVVTPLTLQYALGRVARFVKARDEAGAHAGMVEPDEIQDFLMHGLKEGGVDYGHTGQEI